MGAVLESYLHTNLCGGNMYWWGVGWLSWWSPGLSIQWPGFDFRLELFWQNRTAGSIPLYSASCLSLCLFASRLYNTFKPSTSCQLWARRTNIIWKMLTLLDNLGSEWNRGNAEISESEVYRILGFVRIRIAAFCVPLLHTCGDNSTSMCPHCILLQCILPKYQHPITTFLCLSSGYLISFKFYINILTLLIAFTNTNITPHTISTN